MTEIIPIAFICYTKGWGGLEMNILKLAQSLPERNYAIHLIADEESEIYKRGRQHFSKVFLINKKKNHFNFVVAHSISKVLKEHDISLLIAFDNKDLDTVCWTKKLFYRKLKLIYQQHMQIGVNKKDLIHTFRFSALDCWVSPLQYLKDEVIRKTRFPSEKIKCIPLCVHTEDFLQRKYTKPEAHKKLNIKPNVVLLGIIGRISRKKGHLFIVNTIAQLKKENILVELLIFGSATIDDANDQKFFQELTEAVKINNLEHQIHFVAFNKDVSLFYNAIDIIIMASESETYGMVTIEALLSGIPVIATQSGGTSEILDHGNYGLLYQYENTEALKKQILFALNNLEQLKERAMKVQPLAAAKYTLDHEINELDVLFRQHLLVK